MTIDYNNLNSVKSNLKVYKRELEEAFSVMEENERVPYLTKWFEEHPEFNEYFDVWFNRSSSLKVDKCDDDDETMFVERANYSTTKNNRLSDKDSVCAFIQYMTNLAYFWTDAERAFQKNNEYSTLTEYKQKRNDDSEVDIESPDIILPTVNMKTAKKFEPYRVTSDDIKKYPELKAIIHTIKSLEKLIDNPKMYENWVDADGQKLTRKDIHNILKNLRSESIYVKERLLRPIEFKKLGYGDNHHVYDHFSDTGYVVNGSWEPLMIKMKDVKKKNGTIEIGKTIECENTIDLTDVRFVLAFMKCYAHIKTSIDSVPDHPMRYFMQELEDGFDSIDLQEYEREAGLMFMETGEKYNDISKYLIDAFGIEMSKTDLSRLLTQDIPEKVAIKIKEKYNEFRSKNSKPKIAKHCKQCKNIKMLDEFSTNKSALDGLAKVCNGCKLENKQMKEKK